jgi:hypothetical protein
MSEWPLLDLRDVSSVFEGIGGCGRPKRAGTKRLDADADEFCLMHHHVPVHRIAGECFLQFSIGPSHKSKQGSLAIRAVP